MESKGKQDNEMVHKQQMLEIKEKEKNGAVTKGSDEIKVMKCMENFPSSATLQLLVALGYMATGNYQLAIADYSDMSQPSISKYVNRVSRAIASLAPEVIRFSQPAEGQVMEKLVFMDGMPVWLY